MSTHCGEIVDDIIAVACTMGASDVHFDPFADGLIVRFRLHGKLIEANRVSPLLPHVVTNAAVQRLKVLAKLSVGELRKPQDGQLSLPIRDDSSCDIRISTMPTVRGERLVARIIVPENPWDSIASLGLTPYQQEQVQAVLDDQGGMVVIAGGIGSGKSTTMHAMLLEKSRCGASVLSIEDPVERHYEAFSQVQVDEWQGLTFAQGLRAALRQDPDVLMVGEIRDEQTAAIAVRAGMTGHLIITSIHADHPAGVVSRLLDFGVHPHFVEEALRLIVWQRLRPVACRNCDGKGCSKCYGLGFCGRKADFQLLTRQAIEPLFFAAQMHMQPLLTRAKEDAFGAVRGEAETARYGGFSQRFERSFASGN